MKSSMIRACAATMLILLVVGCSSSAPPLAVSDGGVPAYVLNAGDKVRVTVFNSPTLSGDFSVTGDGNLSFPLIGNVGVRGQTIEQTQEAIRAKLADGYVNDPRVTLEVINYRPFYILGEVARPGEYPFSIGVTVPQAIAIAGGYSYRANKTNVFLKRVDDKIEHQLNVKKTNVYVMPGDIIRVGERYF